MNQNRITSSNANLPPVNPDFHNKHIQVGLPELRLSIKQLVSQIFTELLDYCRRDIDFGGID
jgi:hypothetical protein